eukprot:TRINITY_DN1147_c0_g1_i1.p1 TRINITY_DN1147_c0_g1~~TRINITY_DN1147_c0_g1_i1.p1  ORF type:complete len:104 (-),score=40.45 TRINITY_DN1147_c0_g1_i1:61-372(-)
MTKINEESTSHSTKAGEYSERPDNTNAPTKEEKGEQKEETHNKSHREGDHHKQTKDRIIELEDQIEVLKHDSAKAQSEGKLEVEKEKQRELQAAMDELKSLKQ